jgi:CubicO group peptidase (beta-lactamase class C family)
MGSATNLQGLSDVLHHLVAAEQIAGCALIISRRGEIVYESAKGFASIERHKAIDLNAIFRIYSMSKLFTATAVMMLQEETNLSLDDPISNYLPTFKSTPVQAVNDQGDPCLVAKQRPITVGDLLLHRSGIGYVFTLENTPLHKLYQQAALFHHQRSTAEMVDLLATLPLAFQPGSAELYGHSYDVLGRLIEVICGQSLEDFLQARLFQPLGMADTSFMVPAEKCQAFTDLYTYSPDRKLILVDDGSKSIGRGPFRLLAGGTGLLSTAMDCLRYFEMLLDHGRYKGQRVVAGAALDSLIRHCLPQRTIAGDGIGSGLVAARNDENNHSQSVSCPSFFSRGAAGTIAWVDPGRQMVALFMTQLLPPLMVTRHYPSMGTETIDPSFACAHPDMFSFIPLIKNQIDAALP